MPIANPARTADNDPTEPMSFHESDISWQLLRRIVQEWAGTSAEVAEVKPLEGGMINTTLCLTLQDGQRVVLKISPHRVNREYEREVHQLNLLRSIGVPTPQVYQLDIGSLEDPHSLILMEFVEGVDLAEAKRQCTTEQFDRLQQHLADIIVRIHAQTSQHYKRVTPAESASFEKWPDFYRHVYDPIVREAEKNHELPQKARKQMMKVHEKLDRLLAHGDVPRLVHWDIWSTNLLVGPDESGNWRVRAVLDPNCKYAHAEAEIAYIDLFHTCNSAFMKSYQHSHRLEDSYHRVRKPVYQLYPLINHVNLFGHDYVKPMIGALEKAAALV
jgi:fructosamine-3-kinase